jgi:hypothetical protein
MPIMHMCQYGVAGYYILPYELPVAFSYFNVFFKLFLLLLHAPFLRFSCNCVIGTFDPLLEWFYGPWCQASTRLLREADR